MRESDIILNGNNSLYYRCHKINFKRGGSYIDSPNRIKKIPTINPKDDDDTCF